MTAGRVFRRMERRLADALDVLRMREVPPFDGAKVAALKPWQVSEATRLREEHATRVRRARQVTTDPIFERLSRDDWRWLQDAHLVDLFVVTDGGSVEHVQLTELGRRTVGYIDRREEGLAKVSEGVLTDA